MQKPPSNARQIDLLLLREWEPEFKTRKCTECETIVSQYSDVKRSHVTYKYTGALLKQGNRPPDVILCDVCNITGSTKYILRGYKQTVYTKYEN